MSTGFGFSLWQNSFNSPSSRLLQGFEEVSSARLHASGRLRRPVLYVRSSPSLLSSPRSLRHFLRLLRRGVCRADPRGDVWRHWHQLPQLQSGRCLLPARRPFPDQSTNRRWGTDTVCARVCSMNQKNLFLKPLLFTSEIFFTVLCIYCWRVMLRR